MNRMLILVLSFCLFNTSLPVLGTNNSNSNEEPCKTCHIEENDLNNVIYQNQVYDESGNLQSFEAVVPLPAGEIPPVQSRGIISALVSIVVGAYKACKVTWINTGGFNPCTYLAGVLGRKIVNGAIQWQSADRGKWKVTQTSHFGRIPGCEPMHSGGCQGWYYTYSYSRA